MTLCHCVVENVSAAPLNYAKRGLNGLKIAIDLSKQVEGRGLLLSGRLTEGVKPIEPDELATVRNYESGTVNKDRYSADDVDQDEDVRVNKTREKERGPCGRAFSYICYIFMLYIIVWFVYMIYRG